MKGIRAFNVIRAIFFPPGLCLLKLVLDGYLDPEACWLRYAAYIAVAFICTVLGAVLFGLTVTQSLMADFAPEQTHTLPPGHSVCPT
jgi:hypothetical protein